MTEYEVVKEEITPCGGSKHAVRTIFTVEAESPEAYVRENGRFPILEVARNTDGDIVIMTGQSGYVDRYTFTE